MDPQALNGLFVTQAYRLNDYWDRYHSFDELAHALVELFGTLRIISFERV